MLFLFSLCLVIPLILLLLGLLMRLSCFAATAQSKSTETKLAFETAALEVIETDRSAIGALEDERRRLELLKFHPLGARPPLEGYASYLARDLPPAVPSV